MSRTLAEIYNEIIDEKQSLSNLSGLLPNSNAYFPDFLADLSSGSRVAIWRLWAYLMAFAIWTHEQLFDIFQAQIEDIAASAIAGTPRWYYDRVLEFQYGDTLVYQDGQYQYALVDTTTQIVKYCAIEERPDGVVVVKTAKDSAGDPEPLIVAELDALRSYLQQIKFAGTRLSVVSFDPDQLKVYYEVFYDPIIPEADIKAAVEAAIVSFVKGLPFNGRFNINKLTDSLQILEGVVDPVFQSAEARYGALPYESIDREYNSNAGYLEIDVAFPLSTTITYTAIEV